MGVYNKERKMPPNCYWCGDNENCKRKTEERTRSKDCPLIEIPARKDLEIEAAFGIQNKDEYEVKSPETRLI